MEEYTEVFVWGSDSHGQLGLGSKSSKGVQKVPKLCSFNILIQEISCGEEHSALISQSGYVYTMGSNADGRLGIGTKSITHSSSPCLVEILTNHKANKISSGWAHTVVLTQGGQAFAWGLGEYGALGTGSTETQWSPAPVQLPSPAQQVSSGSRHTGFILNPDLKFNLFMCGASESGQLGTGGREKELLPLSVLTEDPVKQVSCGIFQTGIITVTGKVYMTGGNSFGQLGLGNRKGRSCFENVEMLNGVSVVKIFCSNFSAALTERGEVYVWGSGSFGECLVPVKVNCSAVIKEMSVGIGFGVLVDGNRGLYEFGGSVAGEGEERGAPQVVQELKGKGIEKVACGSKFVMALGTDFVPRKIKEPKPKKLANKDLVNKSFEDLKTIHNKSLQNFRNERNKNQKLIENLETNVEKFKQDAQKMDKDKSLLEKENQEIYKKLEKLRIKNMDLQQQVFLYKEKLGNMQKVLEDEKKVWKYEMSKLEEQIGSQKAVKDQLSAEVFKNSQIKVENESLKQENQTLLSTVKRYQVLSNEMSEENQRSLRKSENEQKKLKIELEACKNELKSLSKEKTESEKKDTNQLMLQIIEQKRTLETMLSEINSLKIENNTKSKDHQIEKSQLQRELNALSIKFSDLSKENLDLLQKSEQTLLEYEQSLQSNKTLTQNLHEAKTFVEQIRADNESLSFRLPASLDSHKTHQSFLQSSQDTLLESLSKKTQENSEIFAEIEKKNKENSELKKEIEKKNKEFLDLKKEIGERNKEIQELEVKSSKFMHENNFLKQSLVEMKQELDENKENKGSLVIKCEKLNKENRELRVQIAEIEGKNREMFLNLEKDLASKAKVYKERTMNLLSGPRSSITLGTVLGSENHERCRTPLNPPDRNPASSLLSALEKSPDRSTTPTKESIKKRINELLKHKTRIEDQLSKCE